MLSFKCFFKCIKTIAFCSIFCSLILSFIYTPKTHIQFLWVTGLFCKDYLLEMNCHHCTPQTPTFSSVIFHPQAAATVRSSVGRRLRLKAGWGNQPLPGGLDGSLLAQWEWSQADSLKCRSPNCAFNFTFHTLKMHLTHFYPFKHSVSAVYSV